MKENQRQPETIDGDTGKPEAPKRRIDLSNLRDLRLELANVIREMRWGTLKTQDGVRIAVSMKQLHDIMVSEDIVKRIEALENGTVRRPSSAYGLPQLKLNKLDPEPATTQ